MTYVYQPVDIDARMRQHMAEQRKPGDTCQLYRLNGKWYGWLECKDDDIDNVVNALQGMIADMQR